MPTTVIQVFGSLTFKTIDSVLKVDHVSEESPLSSLTLTWTPSIHLLQPYRTIYPKNIIIAQSTLKILHNFWFLITPYQMGCFKCQQKKHVHLTIINCLKSLRKNLQWLQELLHVYLHSFMRKWKLLPSIPGCCLYFPPQRASEIPVGRVSKRRQFPRVGIRFSRSFFQGLWNKNYCFYDLALIVIAECFFHSLPVWYSLYVSNMNDIVSWIMLVIQLIALYFTI